MTYDLFKAMHARPRCDLINPHLLIIHFPSSVAHCHFQKKQSLHIVPLIDPEILRATEEVNQGKNEEGIHMFLRHTLLLGPFYLLAGKSCG